MLTEKDIVDNLTKSVTEQVSTIIKENLSEIVQMEISKALSRALVEGQFYRTLNDDVIDGIHNIYSEIKSVKTILSSDASKETVSLLSESDSILDGIIRATERATINILDALELIQRELGCLRPVVENSGSPQARDNLERVDYLILNIMTELSFQDLTGQQIGRVIQSLKKVEEIVLEVYINSAVLKKSREHSPEKNIEQIREAAKDIISGVKSRKAAIDQEGVDKLLEELGL